MIRRAGAADMPALIELCAAHARFERAPAGTAPDAAGLLSGLAGTCPKFIGWVAVQADRIVGYASGYPGFCTWRGKRMFHLDCLYLSEAYRGKGLGRALLNTVTDFTAQHVASHLEWVTPCWNSEAIQFYQHLGAVQEPRERFRLDIA